jgi:hypothetical protein
MLKRFFYASASVLMLALAYHLGANTAAAQAPGNPIVSAFDFGSYVIVVTANGDIHTAVGYDTPFNITSNVFSGPTPAAQRSWGKLKVDYRR